MDFKKYIYDYQPVRRGITGLWNFSGDFGVFDTVADYKITSEGETNIYTFETELFRISSEYLPFKNGVVIRRDHFKNLSVNPITLHSFFSRFFLDGNKYDVYTQYNGCHHESSGAWQKLVTQVTAAGLGIRSCEGATPMMALQNEYTSRITVFHILANCQWQINVKKRPHTSKNEVVLVETGIDNNGLRLEVAPGEIISMPEIIFFNAESRTDLDAWKLHEVYNNLYPRKKMPVMYNTWLYRFDHIDTDEILAQTTAAADLGIELFMVDAGWFGVAGSWSDYVGDWRENLTGGFKGRLLEVSEKVRELGMTFGLWLEPERAGINAKILKEHPEFFIDNYFFDFSNNSAREYMLGVIYSLVEHYHISFLKFDFNASTPHDPSGCGFYRYMQGYRLFIETIRNTHPDLYITGCASGGMRMDLYQGAHFDSFWLSDNQGPYEGINIVKNTIKRMPSSLIERWNVQKYCDGFPVMKTGEWQGLMISCNNSSFDSVINVKDAYNLAFLSGGPLGFSGDIASYPKEYRNKYKSFILQFKKDRDFYLSANARILIDDENITAIEYSDSNFDRCVIYFFTKVPFTNLLTLYPVVDPYSDYKFGKQVISGKALISDGIFLEKFFINDCITIELNKK